jgi:inner membrane protein
MASAFSHAIASAALGKVYSGTKQPLKFWLLAVFYAVVPDADVIGFKFGIAYESIFGHRGFTHSIVFAVLLALVVVLLFYREAKTSSKRFYLLVFLFFCCAISHPILDAMTTGGLGVAFFSPFSNARYFFPCRPIKVSPLTIQQFFGEWGWRVIKSELLWVWVPSGVVMGVAWVFRKIKS